MNKHLFWLVVSAAILAATFAELSFASGPRALEEQIEYALRDRAHQDAAVAEALRSADLIFSAYVRDSWKDHEQQRVYVEFEVETVHRGALGSSLGYYDRTNSAHHLMFDSDSEENSTLQEIYVGGYSHHKIYPFEKTFRYLVYMQGDRIIRRSQFTDWIMPLEADDELDAIHKTTSQVPN